jgi:hypothetical protein
MSDWRPVDEASMPGLSLGGDDQIDLVSLRYNDMTES